MYVSYNMLVMIVRLSEMPTFQGSNVCQRVVRIQREGRSDINERVVRLQWQGWSDINVRGGQASTENG